MADRGNGGEAGGAESDEDSELLFMTAKAARKAIRKGADWYMLRVEDLDSGQEGAETSGAHAWSPAGPSPVCKILLPPYRAPRLPCVLAGHKTSAPCVIDAYVALLSWLLVLVVFFPIGSSAWQCFV